jgi:arylformamidase
VSTPESRVIDLSHVLLPGKESYKLEVTPQKEHTKPVGIFYEVSFWSHVGTHVEYALHFMPGGRDLTTLPLKRMVGQAVIVDVRHLGTNERIELEFLKNQGIREGDIVILWMGRENLYRTDHSHDHPYLTAESGKWLAEDRRVAALGTDASGIESLSPEQDHDDNHFTFFDRQDPVPMLECMANLGDLKLKRFFLIALPMSVAGCDAWPVRILGIEAVDEESNQALLDELSATLHFD